MLLYVSSQANRAMIQVDALPAFSDNYIWLLQDNAAKRCAVVDPGDAAPVIGWLQRNPDWQLSDILITHHHADHTGGVAQLKALTGAKVYGPASENIPARDVALANNTLSHIAFYHADARQPLLFCGDTLFAAGCGRLFEGTPQQMHASLSRLAELPDSTLVYCAHEYTLSNLRFAVAVEPDNAEVAQRFEQVTQWRAQNRISVPSTLALERMTNPFLRASVISVKQKADERSGTDNATPTEVFAVLREWKDKF
jgi:hydroxyacylglutathione hydrolase